MTTKRDYATLCASFGSKRIFRPVEYLQNRSADIWLMSMKRAGTLVVGFINGDLLIVRGEDAEKARKLSWGSDDVAQEYATRRRDATKSRRARGEGSDAGKADG